MKIHLNGWNGTAVEAPERERFIKDRSSGRMFDFFQLQKEQNFAVIVHFMAYVGFVEESLKEVEEVGFFEGDRVFRILNIAKRDPRVREHLINSTKEMKCPVCGYEAKKFWGPEAPDDTGFECHHKNPIANGPRITKPNRDCILICDICHSAIKKIGLDLVGLRKLLERNGKS